MKEKQFWVYIMASCFNGTLYVGVTSNLIKRVWEHKYGEIDGFTKKYNVNNLVYFEEHENPESAIIREKRIKKWNRNWKKNLIEKNNLYWEDLSKIIGL